MSILAARATSSFNVSIGTSLALESLSDKGGEPYDKERVIPNRIDLKEYSAIWINVSTIARNMWGSVDTQSAKTLTANQMLPYMLEEMDSITDIIHTESAHTQVVYYVSNYEGVFDIGPLSKARLPSTLQQKLYTGVLTSLLQSVINARAARSEDVLIFKDLIKPERRHKALILTHVPYDLLSFDQFTSLDLIESHTGVLKKRKDFYTKLYQGKDLKSIPFLLCTLRIFGDNISFHPLPIKHRKAVLQVSIDRNWSWMTTKDKVSFDLGYMKDTELYSDIKKLL